MVYFKIVESRSFWYFFLKKWFTLIMRYAFYRRFYVRGKENLPPEGTPILLVSNHQNAVMDALGIDFGLPLRYKMVFLARADVFKKKFVAKLLNFCKVMPIYRQRDGRGNLGENQAIFDESARLIGMGFPVALFPEGQHQEGHYLGPLKKGFARIAFEAAERIGFPENMAIIPVGNHYSDYFATRSQLQIRFGKPILLKDYYALYRENPPRALALLTEAVHPAIKALMLDIPDTGNYPVYDYLRTVVRKGICQAKGLRYGYLPHDLEADQAFALRVEESLASGSMEGIRRKALAYKQAVEELGLTTREVETEPGPGSFCKDLLLFLLGLPFALYGICFTGLPVWIGHSLSRKIVTRMRNKMMQSSFEFVLSQMLLQGLFYLAYIVLYWVFFARFGAGVFFLLLASWVLTRAFWQDYFHFVPEACRRLRALFMKRRLAAVRPLWKELNDWALAR